MDPTAHGNRALKVALGVIFPQKDEDLLGLLDNTEAWAFENHELAWFVDRLLQDRRS